MSVCVCVCVCLCVCLYLSVFMCVCVCVCDSRSVGLCIHGVLPGHGSQRGDLHRDCVENPQTWGLLGQPGYVCL